MPEKGRVRGLSALTIRDELRGVLTGRVCLLGVGNRLRGDDGAGPALVERLAARTGAVCVDGGSAPENHVEKVARLEPEVVLLADAADFGGAPGDARLFTPGELDGGGLSTHGLSLDLCCRYLAARGVARVLLLGIQPGPGRSLGEGLSPPVARRVDDLAATLADLCPPAAGRPWRSPRRPRPA